MMIGIDFLNKWLKHPPLLALIVNSSPLPPRATRRLLPSPSELSFPRPALQELKEQREEKKVQKIWEEMQAEPTLEKKKKTE